MAVIIAPGSEGSGGGSGGGGGGEGPVTAAASVTLWASSVDEPLTDTATGLTTRFQETLAGGAATGTDANWLARTFTGAAAGDKATWQSKQMPTLLRPWTSLAIEIELGISANTLDVLFGMLPANSTDPIATAPTTGVWMYKATGSSTIACKYARGGTTVSNNGDLSHYGVTPATLMSKFGMFVNMDRSGNGGGLANFFLGGTLIKSVRVETSAATLLPYDTVLWPVISIKNVGTLTFRSLGGVYYAVLSPAAA